MQPNTPAGRLATLQARYTLVSQGLIYDQERLKDYAVREDFLANLQGLFANANFEEAKQFTSDLLAEYQKNITANHDLEHTRQFASVATALTDLLESLKVECPIRFKCIEELLDLHDSFTSSVRSSYEPQDHYDRYRAKIDAIEEAIASLRSME
ncbi:hypothetical protein ACYPKM_02555 [Pseudomonas aeruginosa]